MSTCLSDASSAVGSVGGIGWETQSRPWLLGTLRPGPAAAPPVCLSPGPPVTVVGGLLISGSRWTSQALRCFPGVRVSARRGLLFPPREVAKQPPRGSPHHCPSGRPEPGAVMWQRAPRGLSSADPARVPPSSTTSPRSAGGMGGAAPAAQPRGVWVSLDPSVRLCHPSVERGPWLGWGTQVACPLVRRLESRVRRGRRHRELFCRGSRGLALEPEVYAVCAGLSPESPRRGSPAGAFSSSDLPVAQPSSPAAHASARASGP